jgi:hypothetical protein
VFRNVGKLNAMVATPPAEKSEWSDLESIMDDRAYGTSSAQLAPMISITQDMLGNVREGLDRFLRDASLLTSRALLACEWRTSRRRRRLLKMGFHFPERRPEVSMPMPIRTLVYPFVVVVGLILLWGRVSKAPEPEDWTLLLHVIMIGLIQVVAIACGVYPKLRFGFANVDIFGRKPFSFFLGAGALSGVLGLAIVFLRSCIEEPDLAHALASSRMRIPWMLMPIATGVVTAILVQDDTWWSTPTVGRRRLKDAMTLGVSLAAAMLVVQWMLPGHRYEAALVALLIGLLVGFEVPWRFRPGRADASGLLASAGSARGKAGPWQERAIGSAE